MDRVVDTKTKRGQDMISLETLDIELIAEKLLVDAYALRDNPNWEAFLLVMESLVTIGRNLQERDGALEWAQQQIFP
jgi:hypothetical protein